MPDRETVRRLQAARRDYGEWSGAAARLREIFPPTGRYRITRDGQRLARDGSVKQRRLPRRGRRVRSSA
ncbi:hypothetical protein [Candidatus Poriferisodalis sp.]|uniref:hypothetical protein n=1 Tax=Candidatus Poriferisodalis sp. TaxID=3101277 RepID=UPI003B59AA79